MWCFQFIKLETSPLTNNNRDIVRIISICGYIFRKLIIHVTKFTDSEFTTRMFSRHYGKKCNGLELLHRWRLWPKSYFRLWTWPKTIDKSNQWAIFSLNDCQPRRIYMRSMRSHHGASCHVRSTRCLFRYSFEQGLLVQTSSFYCQKVFHSLPKIKIKRNGRLVNIRWPWVIR